MLRSKVATREGYMEENEGSSTSEGRTRKGVFTIPSVSEIKKASKVSVVTSAPTLFKTVAAHTTVVPPPTTTTTAEALHELNRPKSDQPLNVTDNELANMRDRDQNAGSIQSRKRAREDPEHSVGVPPKVAAGADNERVLPQLGSNLQGPSILPTVGGSTAMGSDSRKLFSGAASDGAASASTSTSLASVHHPHAIIANPVQKKNPVMKHIRNIPWELGNIVPDFVLGRTTCAMFLSVRYHSLHPNYIHTRLKELGKQYQLRILLVLVDMKECQKVLQDLAKIAVLADLTLMLAWSYEEAGRYLETYKSFENKPPDILMERIDSDFFSRATECLTTVKKVNKTDAATLLSNFKTMEKVITASKEDLVLCPGLGPQKAHRLHSLFHQPFKTKDLDTK